MIEVMRMARPIQLESVAGPDGMVTLRVPLGPQGANARVKVTVEQLSSSDPVAGRAEWHRFIEETYGSCAGLGLERHAQGEYEHREDIE